MGKTSRIRLRLLALATGLLLANVGAAQYGGWCGNPVPPCDPNDPTSACYRPPDPDPRCNPDMCDENCKKSPCYVGTGSYGTTAIDLNIRTAGFPLSVARRYDSAQAIDGPLGYGWTSSLTPRVYYAVYLYAAPSTYQKEAYVVMPDGARYRYVDTGSSFTPPPGRKDVLVRNLDETFTLTLQHTRSTLNFGADGSLLSMRDGYGNTITYTYVAGRVQQIADSAGSGRSFTVNWGPDGRIATVQDSTGRLVQYGYTAQGSLQTVTDPANRATTYSYQNGRFAPLLNQIKDNWNRAVTDITWDTKDRVTTYTDKGETYTYTYAYGGNPAVTAKTDSVGNRWIYPFAAGGLVSDATPPTGGGGSTHTDYYPDGLVQQFTDGVGVKTFYTHNEQGSPLSITRDYQGPTAVRFDYTYDTAFPEKVVSVIPKDPATSQYDPNWQGWRYDYHSLGSPAPGALHHVYRLRDDGVAADTLATYEYDTKGRLTRQTSATGGVTDYGYDAVGNLETLTAPANNDAGTRPVTTFGYDAAGRVTSVTGPLGHATAYTYDALDRVLTATLPKPSPSSALNFQTTYTYDNFDSTSGLLFIHVTDPNGNLTKQGYNQFGQLAKTVDALNNATSYGYTRGLLSSIADANGNVTSYGYDAARRLSSTTFPNGAIERHTYTGDGLLYQKTDRKNQTVTFAYDRRKRVSQKTYPNSMSVVYTYQGQKLTQVVDSSVNPAETHLYGYDASFRLASETQGSRGTVNYQYNADDSIASYSVQGGPTATYTNYPDGSLSRIVWSPVVGEFRYTYTLAGQYERITFPTAQYRDYSYDDQGRLLQLANIHPAAGNLATYSYGYDFNHATGAWDRLGQRVSVTATVPSQGLSSHQTRYEYDPLYQLTKATYPNVAPFNSEVDSWTYDAIGNRLADTVNGSTQTYGYQKIGTNQLNWQRLLSDGSNSYTYDANGNTATRNGPAGSFTFGWSADDRLTSISGPSTASYAYDHKGRRTSKVVGSAATYLYSGPHIIREPATSSDYLFGPGIDQPLAVSQSGSTFYYQVDALGSVNLLTDSGGMVQNTYIYDAWGITRASSVPVGNPFGYSAREFGDASTLLYRARYYQPTIGRFQSEDPLAKKINVYLSDVYRYVYNAPIMYTDPMGLEGQNCRNVDSGEGPLEVLWSINWYTPWSPAGSTPPQGPAPGTSPGGNPPIVQPPPPMRPGRPGPGMGVPGSYITCFWERWLMETTAYRQETWNVICCECPPGCYTYLGVRFWEETLRKWKDRTETPGGMLFGIFFYPCPRPAS
jgi:RHS repeat-associated protein